MPKFNSRVVFGYQSDALSFIINLFRKALLFNQFKEEEIERDWVTKRIEIPQPFYKKNQWQVELCYIDCDIPEYVYPIVEGYMRQLTASLLNYESDLPQIDYENPQIQHAALLTQELFTRLVHKMFCKNTIPEKAQHLLAVFKGFGVSLNQSPVLRSYSNFDRIARIVVARPGRFSSINDNLLEQGGWVEQFFQGIEFAAKVSLNENSVKQAIEYTRDRLQVLKIYWVDALSVVLNRPPAVANCLPHYIDHYLIELNTAFLASARKKDLPGGRFLDTKKNINALRERIQKIQGALIHLQQLLQWSGWVMILMGLFDIEKLAKELESIDEHITQFKKSNPPVQNEYLQAFTDHQSRSLADNIQSSRNCAKQLLKLQSRSVQKEMLEFFSASIHTCLLNISEEKVTDFICHARLNELKTWFPAIEHQVKNQDKLPIKRRITMNTAEMMNDLGARARVRPDRQRRASSQPKSEIMMRHHEEDISVFLKVESVLNKALHTDKYSNFVGDSKVFVEKYIKLPLGEEFCNKFHKSIYHDVLKVWERAAQRGRDRAFCFHGYSYMAWATLLRYQSRLAAALYITQQELLPLKGTDEIPAHPTYPIQLDYIDRVLKGTLCQMVLDMPWHAEASTLYIRSTEETFSAKTSLRDSQGGVAVRMSVSPVVYEQVQKQKKEEVDAKIAELDREYRRSSRNNAAAGEEKVAAEEIVQENLSPVDSNASLIDDLASDNDTSLFAFGLR